MDLKMEYALTNESIDKISEKVNDILAEFKQERKNQLRIRLMIEEILLDWQAYFSEETV